MSRLQPLAAILLLLAPVAALEAIESTALRIGGSTPDGMYQAAGQALCNILTRAHREIACSTLPSDGSIDNLQGLRNRRLDLALAQSDSQFHAYHGSDAFQVDGPNKQLRALFSIFGEPFTLIARKGGEINRFMDLKGKRVGIGQIGSGQRATMDVLLARMGWSATQFSSVVEVSTEQSRALFCRGEIDAFISTSSHPNPVIAGAINDCGATIVPVINPSVYTLVAEFPYFTWSTIPAETYPQIEREIQTFGVRATLMTTAKMPDDLAYMIVKAAFGHLGDLNPSQRTLTVLSPKAMLEGNTAPLHPGAIRYFREAGLM